MPRSRNEERALTWKGCEIFISRLFTKRGESMLKRKTPLSYRSLKLLKIIFWPTNDGMDSPMPDGAIYSTILTDSIVNTLSR